MNTDFVLTMLFAAVLWAVPTNAFSSHACAQSSSPSHSDAAEQRADQGMGFEQAKTTHHFLLTRDGGAIQVTARNPQDSHSRAQIRMHLSHIAQAFAAGDFHIPMFVHDQTPPGVAVLQARKTQIRYRFEELENGAQVVITTHDPEALSAIHDFLVFQIREHRTNDPVAVP